MLFQEIGSSATAWHFEKPLVTVLASESQLDTTVGNGHTTTTVAF